MLGNCTNQMKVGVHHLWNKNARVIHVIDVIVYSYRLTDINRATSVGQIDRAYKM